MEGVYAWTGANYVAGTLQVRDRGDREGCICIDFPSNSLCLENLCKCSLGRPNVFIKPHPHSSSILFPKETINQHVHQARRSLESVASSSFHGIMELGGASFQITFLTASDQLEGHESAVRNVVPVKLPGTQITGYEVWKIIQMYMNLL
jgi:hypothetical protein